MTERLNVVTKIIGTIMLGLLVCLHLRWFGVEEVTSKVYLFTFLFTIDLVLFFEKFTAFPEMECVILNAGDEEFAAKVFFLIPTILSMVVIVFLMIATFGSLRGYYWLITLLDFCGISLLYSNKMWSSLREYYEKEKKQAKVTLEDETENNLCEEESCEVE